MKYKVEYQVKGDVRVHRRYYNALNSETAREMFEGSREESLSGSEVIESTVRVYWRNKNREWKEKKNFPTRKIDTVDDIHEG